MGEEKSMKGTAEYVPASNQKAGNADQITRAYLDSLLLELRHMGNEIPDTKAAILGQEIRTPVMAGSLTLFDKMNPAGARGFAEAVREAGTIMWAGWMDDETFEEAADTGVRIIRGIKPFEDEDKIFRAIETAKKCGAIAISMDIDHCFGDSGKDCGFVLGKLSHKSLEQLRSYVKATELPFIFKGILSTYDTERCMEIGAGGIAVSHHKGIWSYTVPPLLVLPEIRKTAGSSLGIFADCGIRDGIDAFKALASGADGVCVARPLMAAYSKGGPEAVTEYLIRMTEELAGTMAKTGAKDLKHIDPSVLHVRTW